MIYIVPVVYFIFNVDSLLHYYHYMLMLTEDFYQQSIGRAGLHKQHFFKLNHKHSQPIIVNEKAQWRRQGSSKPIYSVKLTIDIIDSVVILPPSLPPQYLTSLL